MKLRLHYNAPVVLSLTLVATVVQVINWFFADTTLAYFVLPPSFDFGSAVDYVRVLSYPLGHANWQHLLSNFTLMLLIGPMLEEKYGSLRIGLMLLVTTLVTALLHLLLFDHGLLGASGLVFMLILLSSFTNLRTGEIPLTFVLVALLFLGTEIINSLEQDHVSQFAHLLGGFVGSAFGFLLREPARSGSSLPLPAGPPTVSRLPLDDEPPTDEVAKP